MSHPLRVRGLKLEMEKPEGLTLASHPLRVRGLKPMTTPILHELLTSHPLRVRGLKLNITPVHLNPVTSHPLRMRHVPFSERSNHHRFNLLSEFVSLLRITILSIIINKIQTTTKRKCHYSSIDCSYVIYLY